MSFENLCRSFVRRYVPFTILAKGLLLVAVPLLFQLVLIGLVTGINRRERDADRRFQQTQEVIEQADRVLLRLVDVQTGSRGFVLTENPAFTGPYDRAVQELPKDLAELQEMVSDNPSQRAAAELIANNAAQWLEYQAENVRLVESGAQDKAIARIASLTGKRQMDGLRQEIAAFRAAELRLEDERRQLVESARTSFQWVLAIGSGASLLLALAMAVAFTRGISRRLDTVTANIQSLAQGHELVPPIGGSDEIATVDQAFREMAQSLAQSREELTKHNRVLQSMLDNMGDGVVVADEAGKFLVFNRAAERILGVGALDGGPSEWSRQYHVYLPDQTTPFPPEQLPLARALRGEEVDAADLFVQNPEQSEGTWITVTARPLRDAQGLARGGVAVFQDVTQRKHAEAERDRFFNLSLDILCIAKADGYFKRINPGFSRILGWSDEEILSRPFMDFVHPDDRAATLREVERQVVAGQPVLHFYNRYQHKDGSWRVLSWKSAPQPDGLMYATARDVTDAKRAENALRLSEQNLAITLDAIGDAVIATDAQRQITRMNPVAEQLTGWTRNEALGRAIDEVFQIINERTRQPAVIPVDDVLATGEIHGLANHTALIARDGAERSIADSAAPIRDHAGQIIGVVLVFRDVSEERQAELAREQLAAIVENSDDAIISKTLDGIITSWNRGAERIFGYSAQEAIGQPMALMIPSDRADEELQTIARIRRGERVEHLETQRVTKEGRIIDISATVSPIRDAAGDVIAVSTIARDITEHKRYEAQLVAARAAADSANRAKSDFLASMSHELRTPLNGILGMNELLMNTELTERQRQFVEACSTSGKALLQQINDILDLSKIEAGKLDLDLHECNLEALVYDIADVFSHSAQQKGYPLHCHIAPAACVTAVCDGNRLRQILVNLIGNAMKFTTSGSVTVRAKCVPQPDRQLTLRFSVTDTGVGIPADRRDRLFAPFSQVDNSTSRKFGGTGLGLSICKQLVELMGGQIGVESQLGVGSTFWFEVPLQLAEEDTTVVQRRDLLVGKRVLGVDGIDRERKQIGDSLEAWGCPFEQVATLAEASEAIARAEAAVAPFAVVLADCRLVVGDEYILLQQLAEHHRLPIIGLGTNLDDETIAYLRQLGVRRVLRDPVRPSALFDALSAVLSIDAAHLPYDAGKGEAREEQPSPLSGHVLVAEDNRINQMFIVELLKNCGCTCDVTANGDEALEARQHKRYDLVLMDCQMPEMDGFTATREIRRREAVGELPSRLPVIALTANALKGDRELCLDAGMDDYLSKPLNAKQLRAKLAKFLRPQTGE